MTVEEKMKTETCAIGHSCSEVRSLRVMSEDLILFYVIILAEIIFLIIVLMLDQYFFNVLLTVHRDISVQ
jgi:hypothetical protein